MSKVITFSRVFPSYHPKAGQPTHFVEKIWQSLGGPTHEHAMAFAERPGDYTSSIAWGYRMIDGIKHHTIRAGNRWKAGDWFSPRVWSGKPYNSKQITIAPDIQIKKTWDFHVDLNGVPSMALPGEQLLYLDDGVEEIIAKNDGLDYRDFCEWLLMPNFRKAKDSGPMQIICWNENVNY